LRGGGRGGGAGTDRGAEERDTGAGMSLEHVIVSEKVDNVFREFSTLIGDTG
jgi:hypothetical protein